MKNQTLKLALVGSLLVQATAQADVTTALLGATSAAVAFASWRAADKDPKPQDKLVTIKDVQNGKATKLDYVKDNIEGFDEQGALITDYKPYTIINEKASDWKTVKVKDAETGEIVTTYQRIAAPTLETAYFGKGALPYCKASGLGRVRKELKKVSSGLQMSLVLNGILWGADAAYQYASTGTFDPKADTAMRKAIRYVSIRLGAAALATSGLSSICPTKL